MKKVLFATTALVLSAGFASAEVSISGYGRFGVQYDSSSDAKTTMETRLRMNIDASTETDAGITFGGRIRLQYDNGSSNSSAAPGLMYMSYNGARLEVGNVNTALDSAALFYDSEMGLVESSFGDARSDFYTYNSSGYGSDNNRMGVFGSYAIDGFTAMVSYITPDQTAKDLATGVKEETSLVFSYGTDLYTVAAGATWNGAGVQDNDMWFIGGAYNVMPNATVGLNYISEGTDGYKGADLGKTTTVYGNYALNSDVDLIAYVAYNDLDDQETHYSAGIGGSYDLGGAKVLGSIQRGYEKQTYVDLGVKFAF